MCGIAGFVDFNGHDMSAADRDVRRMSGILAHRGPDGSGHYVDEYAALGHRRLSIIDIATGSQPMSAADGQVQIVFNGEIYNFQPLRKKLESLGHDFRTNSDTEVILHAYLEWGENCAGQLNGMFAFAIWDSRTRNLILARDRVGKKPLFYIRDGAAFSFASELKALTAVGRAGGRIDSEAVDCYLTMGYIPTPRTIYRDVKKLPSAHVMVVSMATETAHRYWSLEFGEPRSLTLGTAADEFEALLDDAVKCRMISEVPLGAFLSGGLDSSLVVSSMAKQSSVPVRTHSIGFDRQEFSELGAAAEIATYLETDHREFVVRPDAASVLERIAWHLDEPFADSSALATWYVSQMTRESVTVALSGDGGDEGFGGYTFRYLPHFVESQLRRRMPASLRYLLFGPLGRLWPASARLPRFLRLKSIFENLGTGDFQAYYNDLIWLRDDIRSSVYRPEFFRELSGFSPAEVVQPWYSRFADRDAVARSQFADINVYMSDDVLVKVDRMSMAHSLEVRAPLLDYRILEFAATLPRHLKINLRQGKLVLRELASRRLPARIRSLPKRGFSIPAAEWLRGDLRDMVEANVFARSGVTQDYLDTCVLRRLWSQHLDRSRDHSVFFWGLLMLGLWEQSGRDAAASAHLSPAD